MRYEYEVLLNGTPYVTVNKAVLEAEIARLKSELERERACVDFYANRFSWNWSEHPDHEYYAGAIKNDESLVKYKEADGDEFEDYCGGKRARETQKLRTK